MRENPLLSRFIDTVSMVSPDAQNQLQANLDLFMGLPHAEEMLAESMDVGGGPNESDDGYWPEPGTWQAQYRPYKVSGGILNIPVAGSMLNNFTYATPYATGYQYIARAWARGMADPEVNGVMLTVNSGGGEAAGCFDLTDAMTASKCKPVMTHAENAYSAAYAIASTADQIAMTRTGGVGSIGVVTGHLDMSAAMEKAGLKMTLISAPENGDKTEGNPYQPLSADAKARMQDRVDELYDHFVSLVSQNRSMEDKAVRATKARTFSASKALSNGLADKVMSFGDSLAAFQADLSSTDGETKMSNTKDGTVDLAAHEAAVAEARTAGHAAGMTEGAAAERTRISTILASDEAKARPALAQKIAFSQNLSAEDAVSFMADLPAETKMEQADAGHQKPEFKEGMNAHGGANVNEGNADGNGQQLASKDDHMAALDIAASLAIPGLKSSVARGNK